MTTKSAGGKITGILALTLEAQVALAVGDPVHITDDYECGKADGTKPVVGYCSVANVKRSTSTGFYPVANAPGDVTVEALGWGVQSFPAAGALAAGIKVGINASQKLVAADGTNDIGILLVSAAALNDECDVLLTGAPGFSTAGATRQTITIPIKLSKVANGDVVTNFTPGYPGTILSVEFVVTDPVTTAAKAATLNLEINTTNVTGGVVALTSANATPLGKVIEGTAVTANNTFDADDTLSVEASSVTAFVEGEGILLIHVAS